MRTELRSTEHAPVTLIAGGSSGIGAAAVRRLLGQGHRVTATGRDLARLDRLAAELGEPERLVTIQADATDYDAVSGAVERTVKEFGKLDNLVASAGVSSHDGLADGDPERWRDMVLTNVLGPALLIRAALARVREAGGRIVLIGGIAGLGHSAGSVYGMTKWAVTALAENARLLTARDGVGVTLIAPGRARTPFWDAQGEFPDGPALTADAVADSIAFALGQPAGVDVSTVVVRPL